MLTGKDAFVSVNLARMCQGLPWTRSAPVATTRFAGDRVDVSTWSAAPAPRYPLAVHVGVTWTPPGSVGGRDHVLMCWGVTMVTENESRIYMAGCRWFGCVAAEPGVVVGLDDEILASGIVVVGASLGVRVGVAEVGLSPFMVSGGRVLNAPA